MLSVFFISMMVLLASLVIGCGVYPSVNHKVVKVNAQPKWVKRLVSNHLGLEQQDQWIWCLVLAVPMAVLVCLL